MRFKCVSKSWDSLIQSPAFGTAYQDVQRKTNTINLLFNRYATGFYSSKVNLQAQATHNNTQQLHFAPSGFLRSNVHSINGFVCASDNCDSDSRVFIFNLTTRERIKLPRAPTEGASRYDVTYDFGLCAFTNEYKVLQIVRNYDAKKVWFNILTLGKNSSWRPLDINVRDLLFDDIKFGASVFLHGAIHWVQQKGNVIVMFNFIDEKLSVISLHDHRSDSSDDDCTFEGMIEAKGCLAVYGYVFGDQEDRRDMRSFVLWTLKDYQNHEWEKETILLVGENYIGDNWSFRPLCVIQTGELAVVVQPPCSSPGYDSGPPDLRLYNMKTKAFVTHEFNCPNGYGSAYSDTYCICTIFEDSIVSLK